MRHAPQALAVKLTAYKKKEVEFWRVRAGIWVIISVSAFFYFPLGRIVRKRSKSTTPLFLRLLIK